MTFQVEASMHSPCQVERTLFKDMDSTSNTEFPSIKEIPKNGLKSLNSNRKKIKLEKRTNSRKIAGQRLGNMKRKNKTNKKNCNHQPKERLEQRTKRTFKRTEVNTKATTKKKKK